MVSRAVQVKPGIILDCTTISANPWTTRKIYNANRLHYH